MNELVSVIVPVYNVEKYLPKCIDSILNQTYRNLEVLLVDDGSTDGSGHICDEYALKDSRIRVFHKENGGQSTARNLALEYVRGEYISFVDSDDYIELDMVKNMLEIGIEHHADMIVCGVVTHSGLRTVVEKPSFEVIDMSYVLMQKYLQSNVIKGLLWNKLYRSELWKDVRFPAWRASEDNATSYKIFDKVNRTVICPNALYHYILRESSTEQNGVIEKHFVSIDAAEERYHFIKEKYPTLEKDADINRWTIRLAMYDRLFITRNAQKHKTVLEEWLRFFATHQAPLPVMQARQIRILKFPYLYGHVISLKSNIRRACKKMVINVKAVLGKKP